MKNLLVSPQQLCKDIDKAIKLDKEFMFNIDAKVASMSLILPPEEKTNKKTKYGKINSCSKIYKELKELKKSAISFKMASKNGECNTLEECEINLACTSFALKFKEIVKSIILNKVVAQKEDREFWDQLLELFDKIGFQLMNDNELFSSLGRCEMALKKKKERENQEELDRINFRMKMLEEQQKSLEAETAEEEFEVEEVSAQEDDKEIEAEKV